MSDDRAYKQEVRRAFDEAFAFLDERPSLRGKIMRRLESGRKRGRSVSLRVAVAAAVLLALGGVAIAANLNLFAHFSTVQSDQPASAQRLELVDTLAVSVGETVEIVTSAWTGGTDTDYDRIAASQAGRTFTLTVDEAYCDGHKIYYTYTFSHDENQSLCGEGKPTGFDTFSMEWPGQAWNEAFTQADGRLGAEENAWFTAHSTGWFAVQNCYLGDGASLPDGTSLRIWDSWVERRDETTWQGYYEVELPEGYEAGESVCIVLNAMYQASLNYVDETGIYQAGISPIPEAYVGVIRVPVTIPVTGSVTQLRGEAEFEGYSAKAELRLSEVDISGEILVTPESVLETADRPPEADVQGYALLADGVLVSDSWGARVWSAEDGAYRFEVRYALPESTQSLALRPVYRDGTMPEGEDIVLR